MKRNAIIMGASLLISCSSSGVEKYAAPDNKVLIINGYEASHHDFPAIGALVSYQGMKESCTVSLIKKDLALTAAHCIDEYVTKEGAVLYGRDAVFEDSCQADECAKYLHPIVAARVHPQYDDYVATENHHDFGLLLLKREIADAKPIDLLYTDDFNKVLRIGDYVTIAGYGAFSWELFGESKGGKLFAADVLITGYHNLSEIMVGENDPNKGNACFGDSGGPVYVYSRGQVQLTGVASRIAELSENEIPECGKSSIIYGLPSLEKEWIESEYKELREKYPLETDAVPSGGCQISSRPLPQAPGFLTLLLAGYFLRRRR